MWNYAIRGLVRTLLPPRVPDYDLAGHSPRYCYSVWLRHLMLAMRNGVRTIPTNVVELGPGASQGVGLAALLSGSQRYTSVDVVDYDFANRNAALLDSLIELFDSRACIPGPDEFPHLEPSLTSYQFPHDVLSETHLCRSLHPRRLHSIRAACRQPGTKQHGISISHHVLELVSPPFAAHLADAIISQGVLLYVPDLDQQYRFMSECLRPGGFMSHQNDYSIFPSFPRAPHWNSHWGCSDVLWNLAKRKQLFVINREPHSSHLQLMKKYGFDVICDQQIRRRGIERNKLARRYRELSDDDLLTRSAFVIAVKKR